MSESLNADLSRQAPSGLGPCPPVEMVGTNSFGVSSDLVSICQQMSNAIE